MAHPLDGCRAKIERADQHINNLQTLLKPFANSSTLKVRRDYDTKAGVLSFVLTDCKDFPLEFSIVTGEALYQLRSALDHLFWQLVIANGRTPNRSHYFPIFWEPEKYKVRVTSIEQDISPTAWAKITSSQPLQRGTDHENHPLWILQELNNIDKHRLLLIARAYIGAGGGGDFVFEPAIQIKPGGLWGYITQGPVKDGAKLAWFQTDQREVTMGGMIAIAPALENVGLAKNQPVIPLLTQLSSHVRSIVETFEPEFS